MRGEKVFCFSLCERESKIHGNLCFCCIIICNPRRAGSFWIESSLLSSFYFLSLLNIFLYCSIISNLYIFSFSYALQINFFQLLIKMNLGTSDRWQLMRTEWRMVFTVLLWWLVSRRRAKKSAVMIFTLWTFYVEASSQNKSGLTDAHVRHTKHVKSRMSGTFYNVRMQTKSFYCLLATITFAHFSVTLTTRFWQLGHKNASQWGLWNTKWKDLSEISGNIYETSEWN